MMNRHSQLFSFLAPVFRTLSATFLAPLLLMLVTQACSLGDSGDHPISRCVPEGTCDDSIFQGGITAELGRIEEGQGVWTQNCASCHGADGKGLADARHIDMSSPAWQISLRDGTLIRTIRSGRPPIMPAFSLEDQELRDLLAYIRSLRQDRAIPKPSSSNQPRGPY